VQLLNSDFQRMRSDKKTLKGFGDRTPCGSRFLRVFS
jgi:hypothetical protein